MVRFGQAVVGAPGAGKSTYAKAIFNHILGQNKDVAIINLDPAVSFPEATVDICTLVEHADVMEELELGPNGALVYCMELLLENIDWLLAEIEKIPKSSYLVFDFPGQAELYSVHDCVEKLVFQLQKNHIRLCAVYFTEARHAANAHHFTAALLATLSSMLRLALPAVNVLSKLDVAPRLAARLEVFTEPVDLERFFIDSSDDECDNEQTGRKRIKTRRRRIRERVSAQLADVATSYGLVRFHPLVVTDEKLLQVVLSHANSAIGMKIGDEDLLLAANRDATFEFMGSTAFAQEEYIDKFHERS